MNTVKWIFTSLCLAASLTGCASFERSRSSGYAGRDSQLAEGRVSRDEEREVLRKQFDYDVSDDVSETTAIDRRLFLKRAERNLVGRREREQYFKNKPYMRSDADRLEFLSLSSYEERQRWLDAKGVSVSAANSSPAVRYLIDINDITVGMTKQAVRESWGEPDLVEAAGNPLYGNERWSYSEQTSSTEGYQTQRRIVYFDSGRVAGWETH